MRVKSLRINPGLLLSFFKEGIHLKTFTVFESKITENSRLIGSGYDPKTGCFFLHVEDPSYEEVTPGHIIPEMTPPSFCYQIKKKEFLEQTNA